MKQKVLKKKIFFQKIFCQFKKVFTFAPANLKQTMTEIKVLDEERTRDLEITIYNQVKNKPKAKSTLSESDKHTMRV